MLSKPVQHLGRPEIASSQFWTAQAAPAFLSPGVIALPGGSDSNKAATRLVQTGLLWENFTDPELSLL